MWQQYYMIPSWDMLYGSVVEISETTLKSKFQLVWSLSDILALFNSTFLYSFHSFAFQNS